MKITNSQEIERLIRLAHRTPHNYRRLLLCAPFISEDVLRRKIAPSGVVRLPTTIITRPDTARQLLPFCSSWKGPLTIASLHNLHAKVYLVCGKDERDSVVLIGSFNFTGAALDENFELGVCFTGSDSERRRQISEVERVLLRMARVEPGGVNL